MPCLEHRLLNLTRTLLGHVVSLANNSALALRDPERYTRLARDWLEQRAFRVPRALESVKASWGPQLKSYLSEFGRALAVTPGSGLAPAGSRVMLHKIKTGIRSTLQRISESSWLRAEPEVCTAAAWSCGLVANLSRHLNGSAVFRAALSSKQLQSVSRPFYRCFSKRARFERSPFLGALLRDFTHCVVLTPSVCFSTWTS